MARANNGPHLKKNERGIWEIRGTDNGRSWRKSTRTTVKADALKKLGEFLSKNPEPQDAANATVEFALNYYIQKHLKQKVQYSGKNKKKSSAQYTAEWLIDMIGSTKITALSLDYLDKYAEARIDGRLTPSAADRKRRSPGAVSEATIKQEFTTLRAAIRFCVKYKKIPKSIEPIFPTQKSGKPRSVWLTEDELPQYLQAANHVGGPAKRFVYIAAFSAARKTSIELLRWRHIDFRGNLIRYDQIPELQEENNKRKVPVPLNPHLKDFLKRELEDGGHLPDDFIISIRSIEYHIAKISRRAFENTQNPKFLKVSPHVFRHTWATLAARSGKVSLWEIAGILGDTYKTVETNYLHHCPSHLKSAVSWLGDGLAIGGIGAESGALNGALNPA